MRESHLDQVERWANFVRTNPEWRKIHNEFINSLFASHERFLKRLLKSPGGRKKAIQLYRIKNKEGYNWLK